MLKVIMKRGFLCRYVVAFFAQEKMFLSSGAVSKCGEKKKKISLYNNIF